MFKLFLRGPLAALGTGGRCGFRDQAVRPLRHLAADIRLVDDVRDVEDVRVVASRDARELLAVESDERSVPSEPVRYRDQPFVERPFVALVVKCDPAAVRSSRPPVVVLRDGEELEPARVSCINVRRLGEAWNLAPVTKTVTERPPLLAVRLFRLAARIFRSLKGV